MGSVGGGVAHASREPGQKKKGAAAVLLLGLTGDAPTRQAQNTSQLSSAETSWILEGNGPRWRDTNPIIIIYHNVASKSSSSSLLPPAFTLNDLLQYAIAVLIFICLNTCHAC